MKPLLACCAAWGLLFTLAIAAPAPVAAQIEKMSNRQLRAETNRAARQAHRAARKAQSEDPTANSYLDMSVYNMKPNQAGHKTIKAKDGRDNYQFTRAGDPIVTDAPLLTNKRLKRKK